MLILQKRISRVATMGLLMSILTVPVIQAQGLGNSPYSALGLGETFDNANVANMGMGGLGVGYASPFYLNGQNPALLARRGRTTIFEVGITGQIKQLSQTVLGATQSQRDFGGNLSYVTLSVPANSRWNIALSLRPYSYVDYSTRQYGRIDGTIYETQKDYTGRGAINRASFASGYRLGTNVFLGVDASFLFGNVTQTSDSQVLINSSTDVLVSRIRRVNYSDIIFRLGAAWRPKLSKDWTLNMGATYDPAANIRSRRTDIYQQVLNGQSISGSDTLNISNSSATHLPEQLQAGISIEKNNQFMIGVEGGMQPWSQYRTVTGQPGNLGNGYRGAIGLEYTPKPTSTKYWDLVTYRAGFQFSRLPYIVDGNQRVNDMRATVGISFPIGAYYVNHLNLAIIAGQHGVVAGQQIQERYIRFALGLSLNDVWFRRSVID